MKFGASGSGDGQFLTPLGIALDSSGNIYVVDHGNNRVQKFDSSGLFQIKIDIPGTPCTGALQSKFPQSITVDSDGNVYLAGSRNHRIQKFTKTSPHLLHLYHLQPKAIV